MPGPRTRGRCAGTVGIPSGVATHTPRATTEHGQMFKSGYFSLQNVPWPCQIPSHILFCSGHMVRAEEVNALQYCWEAEKPVPSWI